MTYEPIDFREMLAEARKEARQGKRPEIATTPQQPQRPSFSGTENCSVSPETGEVSSEPCSFRTGPRVGCMDSDGDCVQEALRRSWHSKSLNANVSVRWQSPTFLFNLLQKQKPLPLGSPRWGVSTSSGDTPTPFVILDFRSADEFRLSHVAQAVHAPTLVDTLMRTRSEAQQCEGNPKALELPRTSALRFVAYFNAAQSSSGARPAESYPCDVGDAVQLLTNFFQFLEGSAKTRLPKSNPADACCIRGGFEAIARDYPFLCVSEEDEREAERALTPTMAAALMSYPAEVFRLSALFSDDEERKAAAAETSTQAQETAPPAGPFYSPCKQVGFSGVFLGERVHAQSLMVRRRLRIGHVVDLTVEGLSLQNADGVGETAAERALCLCGASSVEPRVFRPPSLEASGSEESLRKTPHASAQVAPAATEERRFEALGCADFEACVGVVGQCLSRDFSTLIVASESSLGSRSAGLCCAASAACLLAGQEMSLPQESRRRPFPSQGLSALASLARVAARLQLRCPSLRPQHFHVLERLAGLSSFARSQTRSGAAALPRVPRKALSQDRPTAERGIDAWPPQSENQNQVCLSEFVRAPRMQCLCAAQKFGGVATVESGLQEKEGTAAAVALSRALKSALRAELSPVFSESSPFSLDEFCERRGGASSVDGGGGAAGGASSEETDLLRQAVQQVLKATRLSVESLSSLRRSGGDLALREALAVLRAKARALGCEFGDGDGEKQGRERGTPQTQRETETDAGAASLGRESWRCLRFLVGLGCVGEGPCTEARLCKDDLRALLGFLEDSASQAPFHSAAPAGGALFNCALQCLRLRDEKKREAAESSWWETFVGRALLRFVKCQGETLLASAQDSALLQPNGSCGTCLCLECGAPERDSLFGVSTEGVFLALCALGECFFSPQPCTEETSRTEALRLAFCESDCAETIHKLAEAAAAASFAASTSARLASHSPDLDVQLSAGLSLQEALKPFVLFLDENASKTAYDAACRAAKSQGVVFAR